MKNRDELEDLKHRFLNRIHDSSNPLEGYITMSEEHEGDKTNIGLRLPKLLKERFDKCISFDNSTSTKVLRSLIEFYITETEEQMKNETNKLKLLLELPELQQLEEVSKLSLEDQKEFNILKIEYLKKKIENKRLEDIINENEK